MFFGGSGKDEEVPLEQAIENVGGLFDKKMERFGSRASSTLGRIKRSEERFIEVCKIFDTVESDPDLEYSRFTASHIKSLKGEYVATLSRIVTQKTESSAHNTIYQRYKKELETAEHTLESVLRANNTFRPVLYAYSNHLDRFKSAFSDWERTTKELKYEIELGQTEFDEYEGIVKIVEEAVELRGRLLELIAKKEELSSGHGRTNAPSATEKSDIISKIGEKKTQIVDLESKIAAARSNVAILLGTIDKSARRYDHTSENKVKLAHLMENWESMLLIQERYLDFVEQVDLLSKEIVEDKIVVKNRTEVEAALGQISAGKILEQLKAMGSLKEQLAKERGELAKLETTKSDFGAIEETESEKRANMEKTEREIAGARASILSKVTSIQERVYSSYKKKIKIITG